jgi:hypothetical protein
MSEIYMEKIFSDVYIRISNLKSIGELHEIISIYLPQEIRKFEFFS